MLEVMNAGYAIGGRRLLAPVSLKVPTPRIVGLVGPNGAGKSTLLKLLSGQLTPTEGAVRLDGQSLRAWPRRRFARQVGYLAQELPLAEGLSVAELVEFGRYPWRGLLGRMTENDKARVQAAMEMTHTETLSARRVDTLSGGERQRVWLAMLLAQETRYLLLDEPLAALDVAHQVEVMSLVRRLRDQLDLGVVVILHDINIASRYCDDLVALSDGAVLAKGPAHDLMAEDRLTALYGVGMQVLKHPTHNHPIALVS
jgi:iron complex transport system ATP-binding protein